MNENNYSINLNHLTAGENLRFPESFKDYSQAVLFMLNIKDDFIFEDYLISAYKDDSEVQHLIAGGMEPMEAIKSSLPDKFVSAGSRKKKEGDQYKRAWFDLWSDYEITPKDALYDLFFVYKLRQTDLLELDNLLNYFFEKNEGDNKTEFIRFLKLTLRKHSKKLLEAEQIETINEWIAEQEKYQALSGTMDIKTKGKPKRERDDKITVLSQEQTALLIFCLRETKVIFKDEFLNNKEAGQAFSILTGYSADTIRQNLSKTEVGRLATIKNIDAVIKALNDVLKFIDNKVKPEE